MIRGRGAASRALLLGLSAILLALAAAPSPSAAQEAAGGRFVGRVTDLLSGRPISGATVSAGADLAMSDAEGRYRLNVAPGRYTLRATAPGYQGVSVVNNRIGLEAPPSVAPGEVDVLQVDLALPPREARGAAARAIADRVRGVPPSWDAAIDAEVAAASPGEVPRSVRVLMPDGEIVELDMDEYLRGVVPAEMGYVFRRSFEALRAQAIAARTYAARSCLPDSAGDPERCEPGLDANVDTTTRSQVWRPVYYDVTDDAVASTHGQAAFLGDELLYAMYFARAYERTVSSEDSPCCGGRVWPYLRSVASPDAFLARRGHGAGMSQEGAAVLADWGATAEEIIAHYYQGARVTPARPPRLYQAVAAPREVTEEEVVRFAVRYADDDGDPPARHELVLNGEPLPMRLLGPEATADARIGLTYTYSTTLAAGEHAALFRFSDGYSEPVELDAGRIVVAQDADAGSDREGGGEGSGETSGEDLAADASGDEGAEDDAQDDATDEGEGDGDADAAEDAASPADEAPPPGGPATPAASTLAGEATVDADAFARVLGGAEDEDEDLGAAAEPEGVLVFESPVVEADFPFMAVSVLWRGQGYDEGHAHVSLRVSTDGTVFSDWLALEPNEEDARRPSRPREHWSRLAIARGRFVQARIELIRGPQGPGGEPDVEGLSFHYLDTDDGPDAPRVSAAAGGPGLGLDADGLAAASEIEDAIIPRADWGADEGLRFDEDGDLIWPVTYTRPLINIVHHTVTVNDPADPAAIVRAVYYYHAVTRAWGDIGYNFLVDHRGNVYEGRYGGERDGRITRGGHALEYNTNSIGVAMLGTYTEAGARPPSAMERGLVDLLAVKDLAYDIDPEAPETVLGTRFAHSIIGHRDTPSSSTVCPGQGLYDRLPAIRIGVRTRMDELSGGPTARPPSATPEPSPSATPTLGSTAAPITPTPDPSAPPGCLQRVVNGGFEAESAAPWALNRAYLTRWDVYGGDQALFIGLQSSEPDEEVTYASASQLLRLPARLDGAELRFMARTSGFEQDARLVRIMDADGAVIALGRETLPATSEWRAYRYDLEEALAPYAGQDVRLYFGVVNNGDGQRSFVRIDDVSLETCGAPGEATETPRPPTGPAPSATSTPVAASATPPAPSATATPTRVPGPSATPTLGPTPEGCESLLRDGGFEAGGGAWRKPGDQPAEIVSEPLREGRRALRLGLVDAEADDFGYAAIAQDLRFGPRDLPGSLSLWVHPLTMAEGDSFAVELRRRSDGARRLLLDRAALPEEGSWARLSVDLAPAVAELGGDLELFIALLNRTEPEPRGAVSALVLDEISATRCLPRGGLALLPRALNGR